MVLFFPARGDRWSILCPLPPPPPPPPPQPTTILYLNLHYSLRCSLSANTGSVYCRPQRARLSKLTVVGSLRAHECLTSKTFLFNLQSTKGSCPPHHRTPWISSPQYSLTSSSLIDDTITYLTVADFAHTPSFFFRPSVVTAFSIRWQHSKIFSHQHTWIVLKFGSMFALVMMFRRVVFFFGFIPPFSLSLFRRPFPFNLVLCHWW